MALNEFGALTREFTLRKSRHGKIMAVIEFGDYGGGGEGDIMFYCT